MANAGAGAHMNARRARIGTVARAVSSWWWRTRGALPVRWPRWWTSLATATLFALVTARVGAQTQVDGDCFGRPRCSGSYSAFDAIAVSIAGELCPYTRLMSRIGMATAMALAIYAAYRGAQGDRRKWKYAFVMMLLAGFLIDPRGWLRLLGVGWVNTLIARYFMSCGFF